MMWLARRKPLAAVAAALVVATVGVAVQGRQKPAPEEVRDQAKTAPVPTAGAGAAVVAVSNTEANRALARQQLALIDQAFSVVDHLARNGRLSIADPSLSLWGSRRLEALRKAGAGKAEIVAALEKYINDLKQHEAIAEARVASARGTQVEVYDVQFRRLEAEIWLNEEKAR